MSDSTDTSPKYRYDPLRDCFEPADAEVEKPVLQSTLSEDERRRVEEWKAEERAEQDVRFEKIKANMDALTEEREQWAVDFLDRITWRGYSVHNGIRRKIKKEDLPTRRRPIRAVW